MNINIEQTQIANFKAKANEKCTMSFETIN